jgi:DNA invertase Pin-like site-specific DNA recombinase
MKKENDSRVITNAEALDKTRLALVRCSSIEQNEGRQLEALKEYQIYKTFVEKASAKTTDRPMLKQLLDFAREGDTIYIIDFSRISRSVKDLLTLVEELDARDIKLISLKEALDTGTPTGRLMLTMIGAINEFERTNLLERQREGVALCKQRGGYKGRQRVKKPENWNEVYELYKTRHITGVEAMTRLKLKRNVFYNFVSLEAEACTLSNVKE